jgi:hypothetical protein
MKIKILTNSGFKYVGEKISEDASYVEIDDVSQGIIKVPLVNISFMKELEGL